MRFKQPHRRPIATSTERRRALHTACGPAKQVTTEPRCIRAAKLELLDDVGNLLKPMQVCVVGTRRMGDDQERGSLKQYYLHASE